ncbi:MAG: hypothetical protein Q8M03_00830 [Legionella sp.]|nr:hypothetical protein [Legionella sp.]
MPPPLLTALDAAGLGIADMLPSALFTTLAAVGAFAGSNVQCHTDDILGVADGNLSLRVALLTSSRRSPLLPTAILAGVYAAENASLDEYNETVRCQAEPRRAAEQRRRLHEQAVRAAALLGHPVMPPMADAAPPSPGSRPRIVEADGAGSAIRAAAAGRCHWLRSRQSAEYITFMH